jgi:hypothetical protein
MKKSLAIDSDSLYIVLIRLSEKKERVDMTPFNLAVQKFHVVAVLTADRRNNTTGPGHYLQPCANMITDAYNKQFDHNLSYWKIDDYFPYKPF